MKGPVGRPTNRSLPVWVWSAVLLMTACSTDSGSVKTGNGDVGVETVWSSSGKCGRRGKQIRCSSPARIVVAKYPTTLTVDAARPQVWSKLVNQFSQDRFKIEQMDPQQKKLLVRYTGSAKPFVQCAGTKTTEGKVELGKPDTSPGQLETSLLVRLKDASTDKTTIDVTTRHMLKHKDKAIKDPIEIEDRSVAPLGDGRLCWSTGKLEQTALAYDQGKTAQSKAPAAPAPSSKLGNPACAWNPQSYRYDCP
jgi:hypothetical protein